MALKGSNTHPEAYHRTELRGELSGRPVRIEVTVQVIPGQYQYEIVLFDVETGERVGRGNGGPTLNDAASVFQWNNALSDLKKLKR